MAAVRSTGNKSTEKRLRAYLVRAGVCGWKMHVPDIMGKPDFAFLDKKVAVFVDGCYWHGCLQCCRTPSSNTTYWNAKITRNRQRDRRVTAYLRRHGWRVMRIWEHELMSQPERVIQKITKSFRSVGPLAQ